MDYRAAPVRPTACREPQLRMIGGCGVASREHAGGDVRSRQSSEPLSGTSRTGLWRNQNGNWKVSGRDSPFKTSGRGAGIGKIVGQRLPLKNLTHGNVGASHGP